MRADEEPASVIERPQGMDREEGRGRDAECFLDIFLSASVECIMQLVRNLTSDALQSDLLDVGGGALPTGRVVVVLYQVDHVRDGEHSWNVIKEFRRLT